MILLKKIKSEIEAAGAAVGDRAEAAVVDSTDAETIAGAGQDLEKTSAEIETIGAAAAEVDEFKKDIRGKTRLWTGSPLGKKNRK